MYHCTYLKRAVTDVTQQTVTKQQTQHAREAHSHPSKDNIISTGKFSTTLTREQRCWNEEERGCIRTAVESVYPGEPGQLASAQVLHPPACRLLQCCDLFPYLHYLSLYSPTTRLISLVIMEGNGHI